MKEKKRIVVKIGSSSLMHDNTGKLNLLKIEKLVRILVDIKNSGKDVILVSSGAIAVGRNAIGLHDRPDDLSVKQACAAIGQAKLMMVYQKIFSEYNSLAAQVLLTKTIVLNPVRMRKIRLKKCFDWGLFRLSMKMIPFRLRKLSRYRPLAIMTAFRLSLLLLPMRIY